MTLKMPPLRAGARPAKATSELRVFLVTLAGAVVIVLAAIALADVMRISLVAQIKASPSGFLIGMAATAPLLAALAWFSQSSVPSLVRFRNSQIGFFGGIGFAFTPWRILVIALAAGISEELLFRGVLQPFLDQRLPLALAIILPNILFGALHARTMLYALIAGGVGVYLGLIYAVSGDLTAPILAHSLYDLVALEYTRRAINSAKSKRMEKKD